MKHDNDLINEAYYNHLAESKTKKFNKKDEDKEEFKHKKAAGVNKSSKKSPKGFVPFKKKRDLVKEDIARYELDQASADTMSIMDAWEIVRGIAEAEIQKEYDSLRGSVEEPSDVETAVDMLEDFIKNKL